MNKILFFLPFWWDHVYSDFNPWTDSWTSNKEHYKFLWELSDNPPFDGILFSRIIVESSKKRLEKIKKDGGIKNYLRIPDGFPLFGDCGAFGYIKEEKPPYNPLETLDFYESMQYDIGCTVDHLIVKATEKQKHRRWELTLRNAEKMIQKWNKDNFSFDLVGVAQGWNEESYRDAVKELLDMNFNFIAFGGLVRSTTPKIIRILRICYPLWRGKDIKIHLFGVARWNIFPAYKKYGVVTFDNAYHRKAWLSSKDNYMFGNSGYTALRVPYTERRNKTRIKEEQIVFDILKGYVGGKVKPEEIVNALEEYENKLVELGKQEQSRFKRFKNIKELYLKTLRDRPWEKCNCPICKNYGVHVCVFRGNERNMRRGFHNLFHFFERFKQWQNGNLIVEGHEFLTPKMVEEIPISELKDKKVLVITSCTAQKLGNSSETKAKAKDMYTGRMFKLARKFSERLNWDYVIISAKYGLIFPDEEIKGYEKFLRTKKDIENIKPKVLSKLAEILPNYEKVLILAGQNYREVISKFMDERFLILKSKGYGDLCSKIKSAISVTSTKLFDYI